MGRRALSFIKQSQDQAVFRVVFDMGRVRGIVPGSQRPPFAGRLTLAAGQVDHYLVLASVAATSST